MNMICDNERTKVSAPQSLRNLKETSDHIRGAQFVARSGLNSNEVESTFSSRRTHDDPGSKFSGIFSANGSLARFRPRSRPHPLTPNRVHPQMLGKLAGAKPQFFPLRPPSNEVGVVVAKDANGAPMLIEVLRYIHGASNKELRDPIYTMALGQTHVRVPGPIALLQAKIANVADIAQPGRQDARHVVILAQVLPAYLEDLQKAVVEGRTEERKLIEFLERLFAVITAEKARKVIKELRLDTRAFFAGLGLQL
jgi:hypothetical protein